VDVSIEIRCQITAGLIPLDSPYYHYGFAWFFAEYPVDIQFMIGIGKKNLMDYLGPGLGMKDKNSQHKD